MKDKIKNFFVEKKELMVFMGILGLVFIAVITIASLALNSDSDPVIDIPTDPSITDVIPSEDDNKTPVSTFSLPVGDEALQLRCYYEATKNEDDLITASIKYGSTFVESKGVTYINKDNSLIEVYAIYDGKVLSVTDDEVHGTVVVIEHNNQITSYYSSLSEVNVKANDTISKGDLLGLGGMNKYDEEANNHVSLEIKVGNYYVDPEQVFTKDITDVLELITEGK